MTGSPVRRRALLGGAAALSGLGALSACTSGSPTTAPRRGTTAAPGEDSDVTLAATVLREQLAVLTRVEETVRVYPGLSSVLAGALSGHRRHVRLLAGAVPTADPSAGASTDASTDAPAGSSSGASSSASAGATSGASSGASSGAGTGGTPRVPGGAAAALAALAGAEGSLAASGRRHALAARSGAFARVLASVAAAATQQQVHLTDAARSRS